MKNVKLIGKFLIVIMIIINSLINSSISLQKKIKKIKNKLKEHIVEFGIEVNPKEKLSANYHTTQPDAQMIKFLPKLITNEGDNMNKKVDIVKQEDRRRKHVRPNYMSQR